MSRILVAIGALAVFAGACAASPAQPTTQPSVRSDLSPAASGPAGSPLASAASSPSPRPAAMPEEFLGDWLADVGTIPGLGATGPRIQLSLDWEKGQRAWVQLNSGDRSALQSASVTPATGEIRFVTTEANAGCQVGDDGRYRASRSADGMILTMTPIADACAVRASTFGRPWIRSLGAVNDGRHGIVNYFSPAIEITLPAGRFGAGGGPEAADIRSDDGRALIAVKNPSGYTKPCAAAGGSRMAIKPTVAAFSAYARHLPGFTVKTTNVTIDGRSAAHLSIRTSAAVDCLSADVLEFGPNDLAVSDGGFWSVKPGQSDSIWLVEVGGDLYLLQYHGPGVSSEAEAQVLSTIHFVDKLPAP
jgi:hypothetical protein